MENRRDYIEKAMMAEGILGTTSVHSSIYDRINQSIENAGLVNVEKSKYVHFVVRGRGVHEIMINLR